MKSGGETTRAPTNEEKNRVMRGGREVRTNRKVKVAKLSMKQREINKESKKKD